VSLHTFKAKRFEDAIAQVRRALGPDALIVSRRDFPRATLTGEDGGVEVTALAANAAPAASNEGPRPSNAQTMLERRLERSGVPARAAQSIANQVARRGGQALGLGAQETILAEVLADQVMFGGPISKANRAVAFVGPTGVGKTTTIAKIAAVEQLVNGRSVGLITLDDYRVGGIEQLQRFADLIGCPMMVASDARALEIALRRLSDVSLVLIDTSGRSLRDPNAHLHTKECLSGAQEPVDVQLCLPVALREAELSMAIQCFGALGPTRLTCTKLDEAVCCGSIIAAHVRSGLPLSYFTTGQRVPEDLVVADAAMLSALLCGEDTN
jgi:flagellar biosynthesis protein FlhF